MFLETTPPKHINLPSLFLLGLHLPDTPCAFFLVDPLCAISVSKNQRTENIPSIQLHLANFGVLF